MAKKYLGENAVGQLVKWALGKFALISHKHTKSDITDFPVVLTGGKQTATSTADGGENVYTFSDSAGKTSTLIVRNGTKGSNGNTGATGKGISSTAITYQASANGTTIPTADEWGTSIPATSAGQYLWTRIIITFSDKSTVTAYSVSRNGTNGTNGKNGTNGTNGKDGAAATITVGTVTTGAAGSAAVVKNSGTSNAAVLDFTIPRGATGATGAAGKNGTNGARGSRWSTGTAITGTSTTATAYATGITDALVNDMYLNTSTGLVYRCTVAGNASAAKWVYAGSIRGPQGAAGANGADGQDGADGKDGLTTKVVVGGTTFTHSSGTITVTNAAVQKAVTPTAPTSGQVAVYDGTTGQMKSSGYTIATSVPAGAKFTDTNTDTKVTQTLVSDSANYPLLLAPKSQTVNATTTAYFDSGVYLNPNTNTIAANITGNAATANKLGSTSAGNTNTPVYFNAGVPTACGHNFGQYLPLAGGTMTGTVNAKDIIPVTDNASVLGNKSKRWSYVYSEIAHFNGAAIGQELTTTGHGHIDFYRHDGSTLSSQGTIYASSTTDGLIMRPATNNTGMVGTSSQKFAEVNATNIYGAAISVVSGSGAKTTALPNRRTKAIITVWRQVTVSATVHGTLFGTVYVTGLSNNMTAINATAIVSSPNLTVIYTVDAKGAITISGSSSGSSDNSFKWTIIYFN